MSRTTTDIRPVRIAPAARRAPNALDTASREAPIQPASSSCENGRGDLHAVGRGLAEPLGHLDQPGRDPSGRVVRRRTRSACGRRRAACRPACASAARPPGRACAGKLSNSSSVRARADTSSSIAVTVADRGCRSIADNSPEQRARPAYGQHDLGAVGGVDRDLHPARTQHHHRVGVLGLAEHHRARGGSRAAGRSGSDRPPRPGVSWSQNSRVTDVGRRRVDRWSRSPAGSCRARPRMPVRADERPFTCQFSQRSGVTGCPRRPAQPRPRSTRRSPPDRARPASAAGRPR